jgi:molybdopterin synthase sulfur carrier subunit
MAKILYFAQLVDLLGRASEEVTLPDSARDVRGLLTWLRSRGGKWERLLAEDAVRVTIDRQFGDLDSALNDANEIALINSRRL